MSHDSIPIILTISRLVDKEEDFIPQSRMLHFQRHSHFSNAELLSISLLQFIKQLFSISGKKFNFIQGTHQVFIYVKRDKDECTSVAIQTQGLWLYILQFIVVFRQLESKSREESGILAPREEEANSLRLFEYNNRHDTVLCRDTHVTLVQPLCFWYSTEIVLNK